MVLLLWAGLIGASVVVGAACALALVAPRARAGLFVYGGVASVAAGGVAAFRLEPIRESTPLLVAAALLSMAAAGLGFTLVSALLPYLRTRAVPPGLPQLGAPAKTLVVLLVDIRHPVYRPASVTAEIADAVAAGFREPALAVLPFHYAAEKARYRAVGGTNPEAAEASLLAERVEARLKSGLFAGPVVVSCSDAGALAATADAARQLGVDSIVAVGVYIAESDRVLAQLRTLEAQHHDTSGVPIAWTKPLWDSDDLAALIAADALSLAEGGLPTGIALLIRGERQRGGSGQSAETHESRFAERVRGHLAAAGIDSALIRVCAVEWGEPGVTETIRHLAAYGSQRIVTVPVSYPFDGLETLFDVPSAARAARVQDDVRVVHARAWGRTEAVADLLAASVRQTASGGEGRV